MKNVSTPRTLADCRFDVGYSTAPHRQPWTIADLVIAAIAVAVLAGIALGVL